MLFELLLLSSAGQRQIASFQTGVNRQEAAEQRDIATVLSNMNAEIAVMETCRDKIRTLKQGMMQELLPGGLG